MYVSILPCILDRGLELVKKIKIAQNKTWARGGLNAFRVSPHHPEFHRITTKSLKWITNNVKFPPVKNVW